MPEPRDPTPTDAPEGPAWFERPDPETGEVGLRFACTQCGNCCSGPPGFVLFTDEEGKRLAARLGVSYERFLDECTEDTPRGRSLIDIETSNGFDCVFLDRSSVPGKAVCSVYEDRPKQCRTWPFWPAMLRSREDWRRGKQTCPGLDEGRLFTPVEIRVVRDRQEGR